MTDTPGQPNLPEPNDIPGADGTGTPPPGGVPPDATVPGAPGPGGTPPEPPPGRSNATNWLLAAILVTLVAIVAVLVFNSGDDEASEPTASIAPIESTTTGADETTTSVGDTTTTTPETTTSAPETTTTTVADTTTTTVIDAPTDPTEAATGWIAAISAGDADLAWALMAPESQEAIGGREGFDDTFTALQEGWGAWADATDPTGEGSPWVFTNQIDGEVVVVTLAGTVTQEGTEAQRAAALPVMVSGDVALVQPFLRGDPVEFVVPEGGDEPSVVFPDPVFEVIVPGEPAVQFFVGDEAIESTVTGGSGETSLATTAPVPGLEVGGLEVLTVVYLEEGLINADAILMFIGETS